MDKVPEEVAVDRKKLKQFWRKRRVNRFSRNVMSYSWETKLFKTWMELFNPFHIPHNTWVLDVEIGAGVKSAAALSMSPPMKVMGMSRNEHHEQFMMRELDCHIIREMARQGSHWYNKDHSEKVEKLFKSIFPKGVSNAEDSDSSNSSSE